MHQVAMQERQTLSNVGNCSTSNDHIARQYTQSNKIQEKELILPSYGSDVLSEVTHSETYQNDMANQSVQAMPYFEQTPFVDYPDNEITNKNTFEIEKKELKLENERLLEHIICKDVVNIVMHADDKSINALHVPNTILDDNIALDGIKMDNDRLMKLFVSQDLVHTTINSLAAINEYKSMEKSYVEAYNNCLELKTELSKRNNMIEQDVFIELSKRYSQLEQHYISL
nr:hypothetical protein [Tanacetum cinerariifolium]